MTPEQEAVKAALQAARRMAKTKRCDQVSGKVIHANGGE